MDHQYYQERLSAFVDNELPSTERAQLEAHLAGCPDCRTRLADLRSLEELVTRHGTLDDTPYWEKAAQRIEAALPERAEITDLGHERARRSALWWRLPAIAASVLILGYIGLHESDILKKVPIQSPQPALPVEKAPVQKPATLPVDTSTRTEKRQSVNAKDETGVVSAPRPEPPSGEAAVQKPAATPVDTSIRMEELQNISAEEETAVVAAPPQKTKGARVDTTRSLETKSNEAPAAIEMGKSIIAPLQSAPSAVKSDTTAPKVKVESAEANYKQRSRVGSSAADTGATADGLPSSDMGISIVADRSGLDTAGLANWRRERDSLVAVIDRLKGTTSSSTGLLQRFSAAPPAPTAGTDALTEAGKETDKAIQIESGEFDLIEAWYQVCKRTADTTEFDAGIDFLEVQAKKGIGVNQLRAEQYLKELGKQ